MKFYKISTDGGKKLKFAHGINLNDRDYERIECPSCNIVTSSDVVSDLSSIKLALTNNHFPDFLGYIYHKMASERSVEILAYENISGYNSVPLDMVPFDAITPEQKRDLRLFGNDVKKFATDPPPYYLLRAVGKAELHEKTGLIVKHCSQCGNTKISTPGKIYVDPDHPWYVQRNTWDGSDLFTVQYFPSAFLCSEHFLEVYNKHNLTGLLFKEIESL
jgi:hypothetical protein